MKNIPLIVLLISFAVIACKNSKDDKTVNNQAEISSKSEFVSEFNKDSAYDFVDRQVAFGPRVPGSVAHEKCAEYLYDELQKFADTAIIQKFKARVYNGKTFDSKNIIGSYNLNAQKRVLLCSHWDSRPVADHDPNPDNRNTPIDGANDGASGVGVLLEIARQLSINRPDIGIDIVLFDIEDYGPPEDYQNNSTGEEWGLGAQYWAQNPHVFGYSARYGILLDMVGNADTRFYQEQFSMYFAQDVINKVWNTAHKLGYNDNFIKEMGIPVNDDHLYVNKYAKIPTIDIIHQDVDSPNHSFYEHWHTLNDNMDAIDANSLKIVGDVVLTTIMNER
jgi:hypothetical protein